MIKKTKFEIGEEVYFMNEASLNACMIKCVVKDVTIGKKHIIYVLEDEEKNIYFSTHKNLFKTYKDIKNNLMSLVMSLKDGNKNEKNN